MRKTVNPNSSVEIMKTVPGTGRGEAIIIEVGGKTDVLEY